MSSLKEVKLLADEPTVNIGKSAFRGCTALEKINLENVISLGSFAFKDCTSLRAVDLSSLVEIYPQAFQGCTSLSEVKLSDDLYQIWSNAFEGTAIRSIILPKGLASIGNYAFYNCTSLVEVYNLSSLEVKKNSQNGFVGQYSMVIHTSLEEESIIEKVGDYVFITSGGEYFLSEYNGTDEIITLPESYKNSSYKILDTLFKTNSHIKDVTIPNGVSFSLCFRENQTIERVVIPDTMTEISDEAFYNCTALREIIIGAGVESIGRSAFNSCISLRTLTIPNSVKAIASNALYNCLSLRTLIIGSGVNTDLSNIMLSSCYSLVEVYNLSQMPLTSDKFIVHTSLDEKSAIVSIDGYQFIKVDDVVYFVGYTGDEKDLTLPSYNNGNYVIRRYSLYRNNTVKSVIIPSGVTEIQSDAFSYASSLEYIYIPESVVTVGNYIFTYTTSGIKALCEIETQPDTWASKWYYIELGTITTGNTIFGVRKFGITEDGLRWYKTPDGEVTVFGYTGSSVNVVIPDSIDGAPVTKIHEKAFLYLDFIEKVTISDTVKTVGVHAFGNCTSLKSVKIGSSVTTIGDYAFYNCQLDEVIIPISVTSIGKWAFYEAGTIYCEAERRQAGWITNWNEGANSIIYGYKKA